MPDDELNVEDMLCSGLQATKPMSCQTVTTTGLRRPQSPRDNFCQTAQYLF